MKNSQIKPRVVIGAFILTAGVLALIDKLNIFPSFHAWHFWPLVLVVVGALKIHSVKGRLNLAMGVGLMLLGVVLTLKQLDVVDINLHDWWPLILIAVGGSIMLRGRNATSASALGDTNLDSTSVMNISVLMGGNKTLSNSQDFKGGEITAVMGGVELDLRGASMQTEAVLNLWATWGGILIRIPADWTVINQGIAIMGAIEDKSSAAPGATKRLVLTGTAIMGGVEIKN